MTDADLIWNRAALDESGTSPRAGDRALSLVLKAHGLAMNGGVFHTIELLAGEKLIGAKNGYRFFEYPQVADLLERAHQLFNEGKDLGSYEPILDTEYARHIPDDSTLVARFESRFHAHPEEFAPL